MKELDKMYDIIFENERLCELFLNFHSKNWYSLTVDQKVSIIEEINEIIANLYGYTKNKIKLDDGGFYGAHSSFTWEIKISKNSLENDNGYEVIDTYFHELRHAFQIRVIENRLTSKETPVDADLLEKWNKNFLPVNYIHGHSPYYKYQYVERDAWAHGMLFARKVYMLNKNKIQTHDGEWDKYCNLHRSIILEFISENDKAEEILTSYDEEIDKLFDENIKDVEEYRMGKEYVENILKNHKISELSFEQVALCMSKYSFPYLDVSSKVQVIRRYYHFIKVSEKKYSIKEHTLGSILVGSTMHTSESALGIVNSILSFNFEELADGICDGSISDYPLSTRAKNELKLNMYKNAEGRRINFVKDKDNMFLFSLQPYAKYETSYVLKEFKRLKDIELAYFKKNHSDWTYWENYYNNNAIFGFASRFLDMKFQDYYKQQLEKYRARILKDKQKHNKR